MIADPYVKIMDILQPLATDNPQLQDVIISLGFLGVEAHRMRRTLDEIAADSWEDAQIVHVPPRRGFTPTVVIGGRA